MTHFGHEEFAESDDLPRDEMVAAIDRLVVELLGAASITSPPVDAIALAQRHLGMVVCLDREQPQRGRAQRAAGRPQIYLRPEPIEERHQWTVAHEIGEHLKARLLERIGIEPERTRPLAGESLANLFAHRLLTPTDWFLADARSLHYNVLELKRRYATASHEVVAWRLLDLPDPCVITIVDNDRIHRRRSNAWRVPVKKLVAPEVACRSRVRSTGEQQIVSDGGWTVQGWPVYQDAWRREILRSVLDSTG